MVLVYESLLRRIFGIYKLVFFEKFIKGKNQYESDWFCAGALFMGIIFIFFLFLTKILIKILF